MVRRLPFCDLDRLTTLMVLSKFAESSFWRERIDVLTLTSIKFEMLSKQAHQPLTLTSESSDARMGPFVMYNVSRLSTLFSNYQTGVDKGE